MFKLYFLSFLLPMGALTGALFYFGIKLKNLHSLTQEQMHTSSPASFDEWSKSFIDSKLETLADKRRLRREHLTIIPLYSNYLLVTNSDTGERLAIVSPPKLISEGRTETIMYQFKELKQGESYDTLIKLG